MAPENRDLDEMRDARSDPSNEVDEQVVHDADEKAVHEADEQAVHEVEGRTSPALDDAVNHEAKEQAVHDASEQAAHDVDAQTSHDADEQTVLMPQADEDGIPLSFPDDNDDDTILVRPTIMSALAPDADESAEDDTEEAETVADTMIAAADGATSYKHRRIRSAHELTATAEARRERTKSHRRLILAALLICVLLAGAAAFVSYGAELWGGHTVPSVVNENQALAITKLNGRGFNVRVRERVTDSGVGLVIEQDPPSGERHEVGSIVTLYVGVSRTMPDVVGLPEEKARQVLTDAGVAEIKTKHKQSYKDAGTVLSSSPEAGGAFTSDDTIVLTVAVPHTLPDVVGKKVADATKELEDMDLDVDVTYVASDKDGRTVVSTEPAAGAEVSKGDTIRLTVASPYPSDVHMLGEYFDHKSADISEFLIKQGFECKGGYVDGRGDAQVLYNHGDITVRLCSDPFDHDFDVNGAKSDAALDSEAGKVNSSLSKGESAGNQGDVVAKGAEFEGVRYEYGKGEIPTSAASLSTDALYEVMTQCGLDGLVDSCTEVDIALPKGQEKLASKDGRRFICAYGTEDGYTWTILLAQVKKGASEVRVVVTYAPSDLYGFYDLSANANSVCDFVAYVDMYV